MDACIDSCRSYCGPFLWRVENRQEGGRGAGGGARDKRERGLKSALREKRISSLPSVDGALFRGPSVVLPLPPPPPPRISIERVRRARGGKKKRKKRDTREKWRVASRPAGHRPALKTRGKLNYYPAWRDFPLSPSALQPRPGGGRGGGREGKGSRLH